MTTTRHPVAIVGAGPYGLAAAAHLRSAGVETIIFGEPMEFWRQHMPMGMLLRSPREASCISDPRHALTLDAFARKVNTPLSKPLTLESFCKYGQWFQSQVAPDLDPRQVTRIERAAGGFRLWLDDNDSRHASRVVIATGLARFAYRPRQFDGLPAALVSHSSEHCDLRQFAGKEVIVVGGGQSAVESAALLRQVGAEVQVIVRAPKVHWLGHTDWLRLLPKPVRYIFYPPSDVGPPLLNWIVALPELFRRLPRHLQPWVAYHAIRPAAAGWLEHRVRDIQITTGRHIVSMVQHDHRLRVTLDDGTQRWADHILLGTGYRVDITRLPFSAPELLAAVRCEGGYPRLVRGLESSAPGLHYIGAPAAASFGPLMRFVSGTAFAARELTRRIVGDESEETIGPGN